MILASLVEYYEALESRGDIPRQGWNLAKISFSLDLDREGNLIHVTYLGNEEQRGKKTVWVPRDMEMPAPVKRSSGVNANFLWDNSAYILGVDEKGKPERALECLEASHEKHREILMELEDEAAKAILCFMEHWKPERAAEYPCMQEYWQELISGVNITFKVNGVFASEIQAIRYAWQTFQNKGEASTGICMVTGTPEPIARLHPSIKGVPGAQSSGASLVSFNADSYCSYGKEQGENASVGEYAAFAYGSALNYLLNDMAHKKMMGDTAMVYWVKDAEPAYQDIFASLWEGESEGITQAELTDMMDKLAAGQVIDWKQAKVSPEDKFYILGLAPNAARLSVRFFYQDSFGDVVKNLKRHYDDIEVEHESEEKFILPWRLVAETVNQKLKDKKPSPQLAGDLLRAILQGTPYPATLYHGVQLRIRAERQIGYRRAAIIKGYLLRNARGIDKEVLTVKLNEESNYTPYVLGRIFAVLENLQKAVNPGINATIRDRYFNSACATPAIVFPTLIKLAQNHLRKLNGGLKWTYERMLAELESRITEPYPSRMNLEEQGVFQLGYYHQMNQWFKKKNENEEEK